MDAVFKFDLLSAGGTAIFIAAIISIFILGVGIKKGIGVFAETLISLEVADIVDWHGAGVRLRHQLFRYVHHAGAGTGRYRRDVPVLLTVSRLAGRIPYRLDTSNALFGSPQSTTAQQINVSDTLLVAANTSGGVLAR